MKFKKIRKGQRYILEGSHLAYGARYSNVRVTVVRKGENRVLVERFGRTLWVTPYQLSEEPRPPSIRR